MNIHKINKTSMDNVKHFFEGWNETLIWSCLQGCMGTAYSDSDRNPTAVQIVNADFCFFAGEVNTELIMNKPEEYKSNFIIMIPQNQEWEEAIEKCYATNARKVKRYAIKKELNIFDKEKLSEIIKNLDPNYSLELINEDIFYKTKKQGWSSDLCSQFETFEEYSKKGLGAVILYNGEIVSGASSYSFYKDGIEIEIDTKKEYQRKGLASVCGAKLILECQKRNLYPSWDAQNIGSVKLAEKLGYHFDKEYIAFEVVGFGES